VIQDEQEISDFKDGAIVSDAPGMSFGDVFRTLGRHKWLILVCALVGLSISAVYVHFTTPIYEASASLRIDPNRASSLGLMDQASMFSVSDPMQTETLILRSDAVTIAALQSMPDDQFRELAGEPQSAMSFPASAMEQQQEERLNGRAPALTLAQENLIASVSGMVSVKPVEGTQILAVTVRNKNPEVAATLANHIVYAYLRNGFDSRYSSVAQVQTWLQEQLNTLKDRASQSQKRLADFQRENDITSTDKNSNTVIERLEALNQRLGEVQADRIAKEAQLRAALDANASTLATLYPSVGLQALQTQQATLYARYVELSAKFGPSYPPLAEVIAQRKNVDDQLTKLVDTTKSRLRQEYQVAKSTEDLIQAQFDDQTQRVYALNSKQAQYAVLLAEGSASRDLYDKLQYQLQQAGVSAGLNAVNTMVVNSARKPHVPVEPKKTLLLLGGLVLGLFAGALTAFLFAATGDKLQTVEQLESALHLSTLSTIPHDYGLKLRIASATKTYPYSYEQPLSKVAEAFRAVRNSVFLASIDDPPRVVLMTSSFAGEGKTSLSSNYAVILAQSGARVLIVDIDLRRARLHNEFSLPNKVGLSDLLMSGGAALGTPNFQTPLPDLENLSVLTAGQTVAFPSEALGSLKFRSYVERWRREYDFVLLDSAPLLVVSDTLPIAKYVDGVILVARFDVTPMRAAQRSVALLRRTRAKVLGVLFNDVPIKGIGYGSYYGYGSGYYTEEPKKKVG
jgi:succinoglycan biosynthesis transport protein ExoP